MATTNTPSTYQVLSVENPSFETPTLADGEFTAGYSQGEPVPGWELYDPKGIVTGIPLTPGGTDFTDVGAGNPAMAQYFRVPDGQNEGYSFAVTPGSGMVGFSQTLDATLTPNTQYTLLVNVGNPAGIDPTMGADYTGFPGYALELWAGDTQLDYTLNPVAVPEGEFVTVAFSVTSPAYDYDPEFPFGEKLQIRLINQNENPGYEVDFDNVQVVSKPAGYTTSLSSTIVNGDFEEPVLADGTFTLEAPTGWQLYNPNGLIPANPTNDSSSVGVSNPTTNSYANQVFSGQNDAFVFLKDAPGSGEAGISQTLSSTLTANIKYTLLVDVGNPKGVDPSSGIDLTGFPGYRVELLAGDTVVAADNNTLQIADGSFATSTVNFTVGADNPLLGENLCIRLVNLLTGEGTEVDFDAVALRTEQVQVRKLILTTSS